MLASYGDPILHVGALGAGQRVKLINNTLFAAQIGLLREAVRLGDRLGVDEAQTARRDRPRQRGEPRGEHRRRTRVRSARSSTRVGEFIGKDVAVVRTIAAELGSDLGMLDDVIEHGTSGQ